MAVTGKTIVTEAERWKGKAEIPAGSNRGPFVQQCQAATFLSGTGWPWCAAFICFVAEQAGVPLAYNGAGAHDLADHHKASKQTFSTAQPGDVVDFNIGSGHTGFLVAKSQNAITTIDGNWSDAVTQHVTPLYQVRGFWRIPGVNRQPTVKPKRLPVFTVSTSARGHRKVLFSTRQKRRLTRWLMTHSLAKIAPNGITISRPKG